MKTRYFYFISHSNTVYRIQSKYKPSGAKSTNVMGRATWLLFELRDRKWEMACIRVVTWDAIRQLTFIGSTHAPDATNKTGREYDFVSGFETVKVPESAKL